jgi:PleD family two-component response regulator
LAISQKYAQLLGGGIAVRSQLGQGSIFSFRIPVTLAETTTVTRKKAIAGRVIGLAPQQPTYRILVVEDNPTNLLLLTKLLDKFGFELEEASNGKDAIALGKLGSQI